MRHNKKFNHLGRKKAHREAMLSNMAASLILHKRIFTTVAKAKALRVCSRTRLRRRLLLRPVVHVALRSLLLRLLPPLLRALSKPNPSHWSPHRSEGGYSKSKRSGHTSSLRCGRFLFSRECLGEGHSLPLVCWLQRLPPLCGGDLLSPRTHYPPR